MFVVRWSFLRPIEKRNDGCTIGEVLKSLPVSSQYYNDTCFQYVKFLSLISCVKMNTIDLLRWWVAERATLLPRLLGHDSFGSFVDLLRAGKENVDRCFLVVQGAGFGSGSRTLFTEGTVPQRSNGGIIHGLSEAFFLFDFLEHYYF